MREVYLICNAHLDPIWQWEWEEGAAEAVSTFRAAAAIAEEGRAYVFNHNEAMLYQWIEEYEPELFERIKVLVKKGLWRIIGGWYLQPDCNMPSGEGFIRQISAGNAYFKEKFGVDCKTAVNFDSFGHTRGLVQIIAKSGYESYMICRPTDNICSYPYEFVWEGYDGSKLFVHRHYELYNSPIGGAKEKIEKLIDERPEAPLCILWGVGNHGGGPSRKDLDDLAVLIEEYKSKGVDVKHSSPDEYCDAAKAEYERKGETLKVVRESLNPCNPGCYSVMASVKQNYRKLENELFMTEKMVTAAHLKGLMAYPEELREAEKDMLFIQFHDLLPGTVIKQVEEAGNRTACHGLEILSRLKTRAFFALSKKIGYKANGNYPVLVYNPHPTEIEAAIDCEFMLADQNWQDNFTEMDVYHNGVKVPSQIEKESSNLNLDWRKHVVFSAALKPMQMSLFECRPRTVTERYEAVCPSEDFTVSGKNYSVTFDVKTGFVKSLVRNGKNVLDGEAFVPTVFTDTEDPWAMQEFQYLALGEKEGTFELLDESESTYFSGTHSPLKPIRIIEDGEVRTVVECVLGYKTSKLILTYTCFKLTNRIDVTVKTFFNEKDKCLKLFIPANGRLYGQHAFGEEELKTDGSEVVFQKWAYVDGEEKLSVLNRGTYAASYKSGLYLTLMRTAAYTGHPINDREILRQDRYTDRIDLGERTFEFSFRLGLSRADTDREALYYNEKPYALSFFPNGEGEDSPFMEISDKEIELTSLKKSDFSDIFVARLFNPSASPKTFTVSIPSCEIAEAVTLKGYEVSAFEIKKGGMCELDFKENPISK